MRLHDELGNPTAGLWIKDARLGFPQLLVAKAVQGGSPKFSCNFILAPTAVEWGEMGVILNELMAEKWKDRATGIKGMIAQDRKLRCYGQGSEKINIKTGVVYDGFPGMVFISAANDVQPKLYGENAVELPPTANANQLFVGGNYVSGVVSFWLQENEWGCGVRANLDGVQYLREGEKFGATGPDTDSIFTPAPGAPQPTAGAPGAPVIPGMADPLAAVAKVIDFL